MNRPICVLMAFLGVALLGAPASAQWLDNFDGYTPGPLTAQSAWELWDQTPGAETDVVNNQSFTPGQAVRCDGVDDVIYDFANLPGGRPTSGVWIFSVKTYVPSTAIGSGYVIFLNEYAHGGTKNWSLQVRFNADNATVKADGAGGTSTAMKYDEWVTLIVCIDLDNDDTTVFYGGGNILKNRSWKDGQSGGGSTTLAVLDLWGNNVDEFYLDNARLETGGGECLVLNSSPNPVSSGQTITLVSKGLNIPNGSLGALASWTVNGNLFFQILLYQSYGVGNRFTVSATVPPGLSGLQVGLKSLAAPGSGGLQLSNEDIIVFL